METAELIQRKENKERVDTFTKGKYFMEMIRGKKNAEW